MTVCRERPAARDTSIPCWPFIQDISGLHSGFLFLTSISFLVPPYRPDFPSVFGFQCVLPGSNLVPSHRCLEYTTSPGPVLTFPPGLAKAEYAVGYFTEMGIGCRRDPLEANVWYVRAAEKGEQRAIERLKKIAEEASGGSGSIVVGKNGKKIDVSKVGKKDKEVKMSTKELKRKVEEGRAAGLSGGQGELPKRSSSLPAGAMELQLPVSHSGNVSSGDKLVKTPGTPGKDKDCIVM